MPAQRGMFLLILLGFMVTIYGLDPVVEPAVKEWVAMRDCLPKEVNHEIYQWLTEVREWEHRQFLESQGLLVLYSELRSGASICHAMESTLIRMMNKHSYTLSQRKSASIPILEHDGWQETSAKLKELVKVIKGRCVEKRLAEALPRGKVREVTKCMNLAEKKGTAKLMAHHLD